MPGPTPRRAPGPKLAPAPSPISFHDPWPRLIYIKGRILARADRRDMNESDEPNKDVSKPKPSGPTREVMRIIEEYANDLREIIKKLRKRLN